MRTLYLRRYNEEGPQQVVHELQGDAVIKEAALPHLDEVNHLQVVKEVCMALTRLRKQKIEEGGEEGKAAQRELIPLLYTPQHRQTALYVIIAELRVLPAQVIPELIQGLSSWIAQTVHDQELYGPEVASVH